MDASFLDLLKLAGQVAAVVLTVYIFVNHIQWSRSKDGEERAARDEKDRQERAERAEKERAARAETLRAIRTSNDVSAQVLSHLLYLGHERGYNRDPASKWTQSGVHGPAGTSQQGQNPPGA